MHFISPPTSQPADWLTRSLSCPLAEGVRKGEGRPRTGSAACHFYCFGKEGFFFFFSQSSSLFPSSLFCPRPSSLSCLSARERQSEREERVAQPQFEVSSLSLLSRIVVIYPPAWRFPFTFASLPRVFGSAEGTPLLFPSSLFFFFFLALR